MWTPAEWYQAARAETAARPDYYRGMIGCFQRLYQKSLPGVPETEIVARIRTWNQERLNAVPDLVKYPELRGMRELVDAEWRGWRDGAGFSDAEWQYHCCMNSYYHRYLLTDAQTLGCSYVYFPESDHGPLLANNLDSGPDQPFDVPDWPLVNEHLIMGGVSSGIFLDEKSPEIFPAPVFKLVSRYCRTTAEAVEMLSRYNHFWGPGNLLVTDRQRCTALIEKSACRIGVRHSPDGFGFITAMTAEEPGMNAWLADRRAASLKARRLPTECVDTAYWRCADNRRKLMGELLDEARRKPTLEGIRSIIQFRDEKRGKVCYSGEQLVPGGPPCEHTLRTVVWCLAEGRALWWGKDGDTPSFRNRKPDHHFRDVLPWST